MEWDPLLVLKFLGGKPNVRPLGANLLGQSGKGGETSFCSPSALKRINYAVVKGFTLTE